MADEDEGLPLKEAIRAFTDPAALEEYNKLVARCAPPPRRGTYEYRRGWPDEDPLHRQHFADMRAEIRRQADNSWNQIIAGFKARLRSGELVASGIRLPPLGPLQVELITKEAWSILILGINGSRAWTRDKEVTYREVRVRLAHRQQPFDAGPSLPSDGPGATTLAAPGNARQKSTADLLRAEMRRRREDFTGNWTQDSKSLHEWLRANLPSRKATSAESIERRYRDLYKKLMADKKGGH